MNNIFNFLVVFIVTLVFFAFVTVSSPPSQTATAGAPTKAAMGAPTKDAGKNASGHTDLDFAKPMWAMKGKLVCATEEDLNANFQGAPSRCILLPADMKVVVQMGSGSWKGLLDGLDARKLRFLDDGGVDGWADRSALRN